MYKTLVYFEDLQDNNYAYHEGDIFPHGGLEVSEERLKELSSTNNLRGIALIKDENAKPVEEKADDTEPKPKKRNSKKK